MQLLINLILLLLQIILKMLIKIYSLVPLQKLFHYSKVLLAGMIIIIKVATMHLWMLVVTWDLTTQCNRWGNLYKMRCLSSSLLLLHIRIIMTCNSKMQANFRTRILKCNRLCKIRTFTLIQNNSRNSCCNSNNNMDLHLPPIKKSPLN